MFAILLKQSKDSSCWKTEESVEQEEKNNYKIKRGEKTNLMKTHKSQFKHYLNSYARIHK